MKKYLLIILVASFAFPLNLSDLSIKSDDNSILWKIEKNGDVSYLFGTTHLMCDYEMKYKNLLDDLVQFADIVVFES